MERVIVRLWVPDHPGVLGSVATRIGEIDGNVVGLEVLERESGVVVDELIVELPCSGMGTQLCRAVCEVTDVRVEEVREVSPESGERGLEVLAVAVAILETTNSSAALAALIGHTTDLFRAEWSAIADLDLESYVNFSGPVPPLTWTTAFAAGALGEGRDSDTSTAGVLAEGLASSDLTLLVGRAFPFRQRERQEIQMLARITDHACTALGLGRWADGRWADGPMGRWADGRRG